MKQAETGAVTRLGRKSKIILDNYNKKRLLNKFILIVVFSGIYVNSFSQIKKELNQLKNEMIYLDEDPNDFSFIRDLIKDKSIVILSENSHFDGSTNSLRSKLTEYLVKNLNFEAVLFETEFTQINKVNSIIESGIDPFEAFDSVTNNKVFGTLEFKNFINRLNREILEKKVEFNGIDVVADVKYLHIYPQLYYESIQEWRVQNSGPEPVFFRNPFDTMLFSCLSHDLSYFDKKDLDEMNSITSFFISFYDSLFDATGLNKFRTRAHEWQNIKWCGEWTFNRSQNFKLPDKRKRDPSYYLSSRYNYRDSFMARNITWIKNTMYPNKRIIVWVSAYHSMKNILLLNDVNECCIMKNVKTVGERLFKSSLRKNIYTISFLRGNGNEGIENYSTNKIVKIKNGSLEWAFNKLGCNICFFDFLRNKRQLSFLGDLFYMHPTFEKYHKGRWAEMFDAVFYINEMKPPAGYF